MMRSNWRISPVLDGLQPSNTILTAIFRPLAPSSATPLRPSEHVSIMEHQSQFQCTYCSLISNWFWCPNELIMPIVPPPFHRSCHSTLLQHYCRLAFQMCTWVTLDLDHFGPRWTFHSQQQNCVQPIGSLLSLNSMWWLDETQPHHQHYTNHMVLQSAAISTPPSFLCCRGVPPPHISNPTWAQFNTLFPIAIVQ
jgi:hypothetical protein